MLGVSTYQGGKGPDPIAYARATRAEHSTNRAAHGWPIGWLLEL